VEMKISTRHGQISEATQEKILAKLEKLPRFFDRITAIEMTIDLEHRESPRVDLRVSAEHKRDFVASCGPEELIAATDKVVEKMEQQLRKYKEKVQDRHRAPGNRQQGTAAGLAPENG